MYQVQVKDSKTREIVEVGKPTRSNKRAHEQARRVEGKIDTTKYFVWVGDVDDNSTGD